MYTEKSSGLQKECWECLIIEAEEGGRAGRETYIGLSGGERRGHHG